MDLLLVTAIGLYVGSLVVTLIIWKSPLSWKYSKTELSIPQQVLDLKLQPFAHFDLQSPEILKLEVPKLEDLKPSVFECPTCHLVLNNGSGLRDHLSMTGHGKSQDSKNPEFALKVGSPYDLNDDSPGPGVYRLVLKSQDHLPLWAENERPIRIDVDGETLVYWIKWTGLRRIR